MMMMTMFWLKACDHGAEWTSRCTRQTAGSRGDSEMARPHKRFAEGQGLLPFPTLPAADELIKNQVPRKPTRRWVGQNKLGLCEDLSNSGCVYFG